MIECLVQKHTLQSREGFLRSKSIKKKQRQTWNRVFKEQEESSSVNGIFQTSHKNCSEQKKGYSGK
jgi:hypothetical protein